MAEPRFGSFDGIPSRSDDRRAWVLHGDRWTEINHASHNNAVRELTKAEFDALFPDVPPLPADAFAA
jgi:hypothetical protein